MVTVIVIIIVLYVLYKIGSTDEEKEGETMSSVVGESDKDVSDEDDLQAIEKGVYLDLTNKEVLELFAKVIKVPCISTDKKSAKELSRETMYFPLKVEKLVSTVIMMEDYVTRIYVENGKVHIELGDGHLYSDKNHSNSSVYEKYICKIAAFEDTLECLKLGNRVQVVGVLARKYSDDRQPNILHSAIVVKIDWEFVPEVIECLLKEKTVKTIIENEPQ